MPKYQKVILIIISLILLALLCWKCAGCASEQGDLERKVVKHRDGVSNGVWGKVHGDIEPWKVLVWDLWQWGYDCGHKEGRELEQENGRFIELLLQIFLDAWLEMEK